MEQVIGIAAGVGVVVGLMIHYSRQAKLNAGLATKLREALAQGQKSLPELVLAAGLKDGFLSRGKVLNALNPLVAAGEFVQEEPAGTTVANRLSMLTFRKK